MRCCLIRACTCIPAGTSTSCTTRQNSHPSSTNFYATQEKDHEPQRIRHVGFLIPRLLPMQRCNAVRAGTGDIEDLVTNASELAPVIETLLHTPGERP